MSVGMLVAGSLHAQPTVLSIAHGNAAIEQLNNLTKITNTPGAILNWQQFNVGAGEVLQFIQQNAGSQVFNRVVGGDASHILGTLQSNGQVFLIINFGRTNLILQPVWATEKLFIPWEAEHMRVDFNNL